MHESWPRQETVLQLWNTRTRSLERFNAPEIVQIYVCGITPYATTHLGHARTFWIAQERAVAANGTLILRNDDLDGPRCRPEFVAGGLRQRFRPYRSPDSTARDLTTGRLYRTFELVLRGLVDRSGHPAFTLVR